MKNFNFHHHNKDLTNGIYNLRAFETEIPHSKFSIGIHPYDIDENYLQNFEKIKKISLLENCFAIGECGLDGLISTDEALQEKIFEMHIFWANEIKKPVIIHCVRRFSQLLKFKKKAKTPMIIHGFNKNKNIAKEMKDAGFYLSFGKAALQNVSLQEIIADFPLERLFLETDDADFNIEELYTLVSKLKNISPEKLQLQIEKNLETIQTNE